MQIIDQGIFSYEYIIASSLNDYFENNKGSFQGYVKYVLSDFSVDSSVWEFLNGDVKAELIKLGYQPESYNSTDIC